MKMSFTPMGEKMAGLVARPLSPEVDVPYSKSEKEGAGTAGSRLGLSFYESYARQCLRLVRWEYLGSQVVPVSAYRMAMASELVVRRTAEAVDYGMGGYPDRSLATPSREVERLETPREVDYCKW